MKKVLIFDDEEDILEIVKFALMNDFDVYTKASLLNPVETVSEIDPDIILMDYYIPTIGGRRAVEMLKENEGTRDIKIIFFSANNDIKDIAINTGADGYFTKPFQIKQLKEFLKEQLLN